MLRTQPVSTESVLSGSPEMFFRNDFHQLQELVRSTGW